MLEKDFNTIVIKSLFNIGGYGYKIPDTFSSSGTRSKAPFDGFGYFKDNNGIGHPVYFESKYLKEPKSFPIERFEKHQEEALIKAYESLGDQCIAVLLIGVDFGRGNKKVFVWKNEDLYEFKERRAQKLNILKKEFETRTNFIKIQNKLIDFTKVLDLQENY